jgi:hypothetical protein
MNGERKPISKRLLRICLMHSWWLLDAVENNKERYGGSINLRMGSACKRLQANLGQESLRWLPNLFLGMPERSYQNRKTAKDHE